ncbi:hypothetical protein CIB84_013559 [Bambusicola thoracicus]|uniref:Uncharacterized protein n=1 Tax=Bambusicola thoracicus TaxID=9083 RepID=A0A2P4SF07_BAMTH|nr:hypothetical protein CIB84_013559 [Bambusicola thoracicus]
MWKNQWALLYMFRNNGLLNATHRMSAQKIFDTQKDMGPHIFQTCPSANYFDCKAMSIGARSQSARTYLERHMTEFTDCE